jgi:hypothetical protein
VLKKTNAYQLLFFGTVNFVVLTAIAMLVYPGGTTNDHYTNHYSFLTNFFSDLGRYKTFLGEYKFASLILFAVAMFTLAFVVVIFVFQFLKDVVPNKYQGTKRATKVCAILFALLLCGVVLTPYDKLNLWHGVTSKLCFLMMLPMCTCMSYLVYKDKILKNKYAIFMLSVSVALVIYIFILFFGPTADKNTYLQTVAQKIIVYLLIFSLMFLSIGCQKYILQRNKLEDIA